MGRRRTEKAARTGFHSLAWQLGGWRRKTGRRQKGNRNESVGRGHLVLKLRIAMAKVEMVVRRVVLWVGLVWMRSLIDIVVVDGWIGWLLLWVGLVWRGSVDIQYSCC